jgi:hypothetical protein
VLVNSVRDGDEKNKPAEQQKSRKQFAQEGENLLDRVTLLS